MHKSESVDNEIFVSRTLIWREIQTCQQTKRRFVFDLSHPSTFITIGHHTLITQQLCTPHTHTHHTHTHTHHTHTHTLTNTHTHTHLQHTHNTYTSNYTPHGPSAARRRNTGVAARLRLHCRPAGQWQQRAGDAGRPLL